MSLLSAVNELINYVRPLQLHGDEVKDADKNLVFLQVLFFIASFHVPMVSAQQHFFKSIFSNYA